jgi:hypothetical protein
MQRLQRLFNGLFIFPAMNPIEVDMVRAEPFEAGIDGLKDGLARQPGFV